MFNFEKYRKINNFVQKVSKNTKIIAISKNHPKESVVSAIKAGVNIFGENRVLEAKSKFLEIKTKFPDLQLHLTGPLQSNKVKQAVTLFDVFHTLDREKIAKEFSKYEHEMRTKKIFIQVNTGNEITKSGISEKDLKNFLAFCKLDLRLNICGLMCIPPIVERPEHHFDLLSKLANQNNLNELSIGMSNDYEVALKFNPTYIRLGTVLFGVRK